MLLSRSGGTFGFMTPGRTFAVSAPVLSCSANASEFSRAELQAFTEHCQRWRPGAWATVLRLQLACLCDRPASPEGFAHAESVLRHLSCDL